MPFLGRHLANRDPKVLEDGRQSAVADACVEDGIGGASEGGDQRAFDEGEALDLLSKRGHLPFADHVFGHSSLVDELLDEAEVEKIPVPEQAMEAHAAMGEEGTDGALLAWVYAVDGHAGRLRIKRLSSLP